MDVHFLYLYNLSNNLPSIGERISGIESLLIEPMWFHQNADLRSLCDMIILYRDGSAGALELKGCLQKRNKAKDQIQHGYEYIEQVLNRPVRQGIFAVYTPSRYLVERYARSMQPIYK